MSVLGQLGGGRIDELIGRAAGEWSKAWQYSITKNFQAGGRPPWAVTNRGGSILQKTGRLRNSIRTESIHVAEGRYNIVGSVSGLRYARIHQLGGTITPVSKKALAVPLTEEAAKKAPADWGKELFFNKGKDGKAPTLCTTDKKGNVTAQYVLLRSVKIPPRPYFIVQDDDKDTMRSLLKEVLR